MMIQRDYDGVPVFLRIVKKNNGTPSFQVIVNGDIQRYKIKRVIEGRAVDGFGFGVDLEDILDTIQLFLESTHTFVVTSSGKFGSDIIAEVFKEFKKYLMGEPSKVEIKDRNVIYEGKPFMSLNDLFYSINEIIVKHLSS